MIRLGTTRGPRELWLLFLLFVTASCGGEEAGDRAPPPTHRPNVLILLWDTVRADRLQPYGYPMPTTPRLVELARESRVFERCISPGMWTIPSHASMFTGLPARSHGARASYKRLGDQFHTLAEYLHAADYQTYAFSANPYVSALTNLVQGFETVEHPWDERWKDLVRTRTEANQDPRDRSLRRPEYEKDSGLEAKTALLEWLDARDPSQPFFAFVNYMEAHHPRMPSREARQRVLSPAMLQATLRVNQSKRRLLSYTLGAREIPPEDIEALSAIYDACLYDLDAATGAMLDALRERDLLDDTLVILTADHGENLGDHHLFSHKFSLHDTLIHVPLLIRWPGRVEPGREPTAVSTRDVFATVLDAAGSDLPDPNLCRSLLAPLEAEDTPGVVSELIEPTVEAFEIVAKTQPDYDFTPWLRTYQSVERDGLKLLEDSDGVRRLYDVREDPGELRDLAAEHSSTVREHAAELERFRQRHSAHLPTGDDVGPLSPDMIRRLSALGYRADEEVDDGEDEEGRANGDEQPDSDPDSG